VTAQQLPEVEPYPSELPKIKRAFAKLQRRFWHSKFDEATVDQFHRAALDLFAEAGFTIGIVWDEVHENGKFAGLYLPTITIMGRVNKEEETDHDRLQHEITHGLADGQPGYVRADGTLHEDPKKKNL
jgi:hypothetical protein